MFLSYLLYDDLSKFLTQQIFSIFKNIKESLCICCSSIDIINESILNKICELINSKIIVKILVSKNNNKYEYTIDVLKKYIIDNTTDKTLSFFKIKYINSCYLNVNFNFILLDIYNEQNQKLSFFEKTNQKCIILNSSLFSNTYRKISINICNYKLVNSLITFFDTCINSNDEDQVSTKSLLNSDNNFVFTNVSKSIIDKIYINKYSESIDDFFIEDESNILDYFLQKIYNTNSSIVIYLSSENNGKLNKEFIEALTFIFEQGIKIRIVVDSYIDNIVLEVLSNISNILILDPSIKLSGISCLIDNKILIFSTLKLIGNSHVYNVNLIMMSRDVIVLNKFIENYIKDQSKKYQSINKKEVKVKF